MKPGDKMKNIFLFLVISILSVSAQTWKTGWMQPFKTWDKGWKSVSTIRDTSSTDTFTTVPQVVYIEPNQLSVTWNPAQIDSTDWNTLKFTFEYTQNTTYSTQYFTIPAATAKVDSDSTFAFDVIFSQQTFDHQSITFEDTTEVMKLTVTLIDSSGNSISMKPQYDTMYLDSINYMPVSRTSIVYNGNVLDSIYYQFSPSGVAMPSWMDSTYYLSRLWTIARPYTGRNISLFWLDGDLWGFSQYETYINLLVDSMSFITDDNSSFNESLVGDSIITLEHSYYSGNVNGKLARVFLPPIPIDTFIIQDLADITPPDSGTITAKFVPGNNLDFTITPSDSSDAQNIIIDAHNGSSWTNIAQISSDSTHFNTSVSGVLYVTGDKTIPLRASWGDEAENYSGYAYDTIFPTGTPNIYTLSSSFINDRTLIGDIKFFVNDSSVLASSDSTYIIHAADSLTGHGDSILVDIPDTLLTQFDTTHMTTRIQYSGLWQDTTSAWVTYPASAGGGGSYTQTFAWTGESASGELYADSLGTEFQMSLVPGGTVGTNDNHTAGGSYSYYLYSYRNLYGVVSTNVFNPDEGMLDIWIKPTDFSIVTVFFAADDDGASSTDQFRLQYSTDSTVYIRHEGNNVATTIEASIEHIQLNQWNRIMARWSVTNNVLSININNAGWEETTDTDAMTSVTTTLNYLRIGVDRNSSAGGNGFADDCTLYEYDHTWNGD